MIIVSCKLLSFDTSTKSTGYSLYVSGKLKKYDSINFEYIKNTDDRVKEMIVHIYKLIQDIKPQIVVTEMTVVTRNAQAQRNLTMILGAIYGECIKKDIFYYTYRPTEWRKLVNTDEQKIPRKREDLKVWSINMVHHLFGITDINDDISDAILLGQAYINNFS